MIRSPSGSVGLPRLAGYLAVAALLTGGALAQQAPEGLAPLTDDEKILHALARLSFGPRPGQVEAVKALGLQKWIDQQLDPASLADDTVAERLTHYETLGLAPKQMRALQDAKAKAAPEGQKPDRESLYRQAARELKLAVVQRALHSERQTFEVLADFWRNHFNVDTGKDSVQWTATHFEESALRPHLLGRFGDLLEATAHHPAMLVYLDNALSRRPPPKSELRQVERRARRQTGSREAAKEQVEIAKQAGLNENYARELMELHTLGVDNGYTQKDVTEVARALTGWTVDFDADGPGFAFKEDLHDPGPKVVLGKPLPEGKRDEGIIEGEAVLKRLAAHDNTAEFISRKLTRHLVDDTPPPAIADAGARAFKRSKGDLKETVRAIVGHPEFWSRAHYRAKFKTPLEFVISALRATDATAADPQVVVDTISDLGLRVYGMLDPTGWSDAAEAWRDPGVMALRWKFALALTAGKIPGLAIPPAFFDGLPSEPADLAAALVTRIVPHGLSPATAGVIERLVFQEVQKGTAGAANGRRDLARKLAGVLLGSPEFQQQ